MFRAHRTHHPERQIVSIQHLVAVTMCRWPCRLQVGSEVIYQESLHDARSAKYKSCLIVQTKGEIVIPFCKLGSVTLSILSYSNIKAETVN